MNNAECAPRESKPIRIQQCCNRLENSVERLQDAIERLDNGPDSSPEKLTAESRQWSVVESIDLGADVVANQASRINALIDRMEELLY